MAARAIIGIALGIIFAPVIFLLIYSVGQPTAFSTWFWSMMSDISTFFTNWMGYGAQSMAAPIMQNALFPNSLIEGFGAGSLLTGFLPAYAPALVTWTILGAWAGAIERSPGRGVGVGAGIWIGWLIIEVIYMLIYGLTAFLVDALIAQLLTLIVVILVALVFGAMTKSEEF